MKNWNDFVMLTLIISSNILKQFTSISWFIVTMLLTLIIAYAFGCSANIYVLINMQQRQTSKEGSNRIGYDGSISN